MRDFGFNVAKGDEKTYTVAVFVAFHPFPDTRPFAECASGRGPADTPSEGEAAAGEAGLSRGMTDCSGWDMAAQG